MNNRCFICNSQNDITELKIGDIINGQKYFICENCKIKLLEHIEGWKIKNEIPCNNR